MTVVAIWSILFYALLVAIGGLIGYLKVKSQMSLISGGVSGILLCGAFFLGLQNPGTGLLLASVIEIALTFVFAMRFRSTQKFMPAGLLAIVSLVATLGYGVVWFGLS
jgi:uncharacterized membrane protein (UPF0136 family)